MACKFYSNGDTVTTKATKAIKAGDLVKVGVGLVGVATTDAQANENCTVSIKGAFVMPKGQGAIKAGDPIHFKEADNAVSNTEGDGVKVGVALQDAEAKDATVVVKMQ
jgi:hypothetical protein|nr:MAG TPA: protein of unknown function DUF2190 [Caudoviricetes sp.]